MLVKSFMNKQIITNNIYKIFLAFEVKINMFITEVQSNIAHFSSTRIGNSVPHQVMLYIWWCKASHT